MSTSEQDENERRRKGYVRYKKKKESHDLTRESAMRAKKEKERCSFIH
jgi:hypothetical protein